MLFSLARGEKMEYIVSAVMMTLELFSFVLLSDAFFERVRSKKVFWSIAGCFSVALFFLVTFILTDGVIRPLFTVLLHWGLVLILYGKRNFVVKGVLCALWMALCIGIDVTAMYFACALLNISLTQMLTTPVVFTVITIAGKLLLVFITALVKHVHPQSQAAIKIQWSRLLLLLFFPAVSGAIMALTMRVGYTHNEYAMPFFIGGAGLTLANVFLFVIVDKLEKDAQLREESLVRMQQAELQMEHLAALEAAYAAQRKLTHDYNQHISVLGKLLAESQIENAQIYLEKITKQAPTRVGAVRCGCAVLDALFNQKYVIAQEANIDVQISVNDLSGIRMKQEDIVVVLANLLDNALEACARVEGKRAVQVQLTLQEDDIFLSVCNTSVPVEIRNGSIASTKPNPSEHGFGLQNVKTILKMYRAEFVMLYEKGCFQFTAEIPNFPVS